MRVLSAFMLAAAVLVTAGCGGGKTSTTTTAVAQPTTEAARETAALPLTQAAAVPTDVKCGAVKPVWVNIRSKAYHEPDDPYYGRTKNGKYMCPSEAAAQGYHAAGTRTHHKKAKPSETATAGP